MNPLEAKLKGLPTSPGVYLMKDGKGVIIYVGKAKNLKNRVQSYFQNRDQHVKTDALVAEIRDLELMLTDTEVEALLLERTLIKHHKPRYNINLQDDKEYPFVRVDFRETWPRLEKVRRRQDDGAVYLGPFGNAGVLNTMLKTVGRIFPLIKCSRHEFRLAQRPCSYYHMKMCLAPCSRAVDRDEYVFMVQSALALLEGKNRKLIHTIEQRMKDAARQEQFERAAAYRDQIFALERIGDKQAAVVQTIEDADVVNYVETPATAKGPGTISFHVLMIRNGMVVGGENFVAKNTALSPEEGLSHFLLQYYDRRMVCDAVILPVKLADSDELATVLSKDRERPVKISAARSPEAKGLIALAEKNAEHHLAHKDEQKKRAKVELEVLKETLALERPPQVIECIDISNLQGTHIVASSVCFVDGKPDKDRYRVYNIRSVATQDDFTSVFEVVKRRLERAVRDEEYPDLLVIDGGKGQLGAALKALAEFPGLALPMVGLAKSRLQKDDDKTAAPTHSTERIFFPDREEPLDLEEGSPSFRLLTRLRDEAHRFAINFHRKKRAAGLQSSYLDDIAGIGPVLRKRLLLKFQGLDGIKKASLDELEQVEGLKKPVALALFHKLREEEDGTS